MPRQINIPLNNFKDFIREEINLINYREVDRPREIQNLDEVLLYEDEELEIENYNTVFYYNATELFGNNGAVEKADVLQNLVLEIDRLSWILFEKNKICGANSIDIFSPRTAGIFDMVNVLTDSIKFNTKNNYSEEDSYFIGEFNGKYKVFMPKETTRVVMSEKTHSKRKCSEKFFTEKRNIIELYNSEIPEIRFTINLENHYEQ